jgi:diphthamide synthase subunit DPH2
MNNSPVDRFNVGDKVIYLPHHVKGDKDHEDCEYGIVTQTDSRRVYVMFNDDYTRGSKACNPEQLRHQ